MSTYDDKTLKSVAEAVKKVMEEELKGNQHKIDANKNNKIDAHDFKLLRAKKKAPFEGGEDKPEVVTDKSGAKHGPMSRAKDLARRALKKEQVEQIDESVWDYKNAGTAKKTGETTRTGHDIRKTSTGTVYTKRAPAEKDEGQASTVSKKSKSDLLSDEEFKKKHGMSRKNYERMKSGVKIGESFSEMIDAYDEYGLAITSAILEEKESKKKCMHEENETCENCEKEMKEEINLEDFSLEELEEFVAEGRETQKSFKVIYRNPKTGLEHTRNIISNDEEAVVSHFKSKGLEIVSIKYMGLADKIDDDRRLQYRDEDEDEDDQGVAEGVVMPPASFIGTQPPTEKSAKQEKADERDVRLLKKYREKNLGLGSALERLKKYKQKHNGQNVAEGSTKVDMVGKKCNACKKGTYQETKVDDDMRGTLHCTKCNKEVNRWQAPKQQGVMEGKLKEDNEQLDEISKQTLGSYIKKASHDIATKGAVTRQFANDARQAEKEGNYTERRKKEAMTDKVFKKSWKRRMGVAKAVDRLTKEEFEQLDEISTKLLARAASAASDPDAEYAYDRPHDPQKFADHAAKKKDAKSAAAVQGAADAKGHYPRPGHTSGYDKLAHRKSVRMTTSGKANRQDINRLKNQIKNEEFELDERTLSKSEMEKREEYVKGMKKKLSGFKSRYGDRAKSVMYATATRMAKGDKE